MIELLSMRSKTLTSQFDNTVPVNRDFYPYMFVKQISHWLSYFGTKYKILIIIPVLLFLLLFLRTDRITAGLYTGGFTAASLEVTLLLRVPGLFWKYLSCNSIIFCPFYGWSGIGKFIKTNSPIYEIKSYYFLQFALAFFAMILPLLIHAAGKLTALTIPVQIFFFILIFGLATGIGYEFLLASRLRTKSYSETSGENYSTDLLGSAFGAFLTAIVLLPLIGVVYTCFVVAALNLFSGLLAYSKTETINANV